MSIHKFIMALTLLGVVLLTQTSSAFGAGDPLDALAPKSVVSQGNLARLDRVFERAMAGRHVTIAAIGGSITQGAMATKPRYNYPSLVAQWFARTFPKAKVSLVNAGVGATGTHYGCLRVKHDVLSHHPNLVIVEFAVNDGAQKSYSETYEGLIRHILSAPDHPAVIELFLIFGHNGVTEEVPEEKIGYHYDLPMISYRNAVWPLLKAKKLAWSAIQVPKNQPGYMHPNDRGHALIAYFVTHFLHQCLNKLTKYSTDGFPGPQRANLPSIQPLPKPLYTSIYAHARYWSADSLKPVSNHGWKFPPAKIASMPAIRQIGSWSSDKAGVIHGNARTVFYNDRFWTSDKPGSVITFHIPGRVIFLSFYRHDGPYGKVRVQVDHNPPRILNAWFPGTWGGYRKTDIIATKLPPGVHTVRVTLLKSHSAGSTGHQFCLLGLGAAGITTHGKGMIQ